MSTLGLYTHSRTLKKRKVHKEKNLKEKKSSRIWKEKNLKGAYGGNNGRNVGLFNFILLENHLETKEYRYLDHIFRYTVDRIAVFLNTQAVLRQYSIGTVP